MQKKRHAKSNGEKGVSGLLDSRTRLSVTKHFLLQNVQFHLVLDNQDVCNVEVILNEDARRAAIGRKRCEKKV
jgi:hypothetical protein